MKKRFFITWVTHNSRYSEKMRLLKIKKQEGYFLDTQARINIYNLISKRLDEAVIYGYYLNVLSDHVHLVFEYKEEDLSEFIRKLKGGVSFEYSREMNFSFPGEGKINKIWARGFSKTYINTDEQYKKSVTYTLRNHEKHEIEDIYPYINRGL